MLIGYCHTIINERGDEKQRLVLLETLAELISFGGVL